MSKPQDRIISENSDGMWENKRLDGEQASTLHETQDGAYTEARNMLQNQGGGEIIIKGKDGEIREKNTIAPGNDPANVPG